MPVIGNYNRAVYLNPNAPNVDIVGNITGYGQAGYIATTNNNGKPSYTPVFAAVYGGNDAHFSIGNNGVISSPGASTLDGGIVLTQPGIVSNTGTIAGGAGILMFGNYGSGYIKNTALIQGRAGAAIYADAATGINNSGLIAGNTNGIYLASGGNVQNTGTVTGGTGISLTYTPGNIYNAGQIRGLTTNGVFLYGSIVNAISGAIRGHDSGINLADGGAVANAGLINGYATGILTYGYTGAATATNITNTGSINGGVAGIGIAQGSPPAFIYNAPAGRITGAHYAIAVYSAFATLPSISIGNAGYIDGSGGNDNKFPSNPQAQHIPRNAGNSAIIMANGDITNTGTIQGGANAIYASGNLNLINTNIISAPGYALNILTVATIQNTGIINGGGVGILLNAGIISNSGTIASNLDAIEVIEAASVTNTSTGTITGATGIFFGVDAGNNLTNSGLITASLNNAVEANGLSLFNAGTIRANSRYANGGAVKIEGQAYIINTGTIASNQVGVTFAAGGLYNYGLINGGTAGVANFGTPGKSFYIYNSGQIGASNPAGIGVELTTPGYLINGATGTISAAVGVLVLSGASLYNYGHISGGVTGNGQSGIYNYGGATITGGITLATASNIYNAGLISGSTSSIDFEDRNANNRLILTPAATLTGTAELNGGALSLTEGSTAGSIALSQFTNLTQITLDSNATWTIQASATGNPNIDVLGNATLNLTHPNAFTGNLENFAPTDTIDLTGISLSSIIADTFAAGILTLTESTTSITLTFANPKTFAPDTFSLFADGTGTGIVLANPLAPMAFATPSSTNNTPSTALPDLAAAYASQPASQSTTIPQTTLSHPGWLSPTYGQTSAAPIPITLHA